MKPYVLNYSETIKLKKTDIQIIDSTRITETIENSDDEIIANSTKQTFVIEPEDPDEFHTYESTLITKTIEPTDDDEIYFLPLTSRFS